MKQIRILLPLLLLFAMGCNPIYEDMSHCPPDEEFKVTLDFRYMPDGTDAFAANVGNATVAVYDPQGNFVSQHSVSQADLDKFQGAKMNLDPGTYRIVCWGNVDANSAMCDLSQYTLAQATLMHTLCASGSAANGDRLFYGPAMDDIASPTAFNITVPQTGNVRETLYFTAAHNTIELYIKGASAMPLITIDGLSQGYDFSMRTFAATMDYAQTATTVTLANQTCAGAQFHVPQFTDDCDITIDITTPDSSWPISLKEFLTDNSITVSPVRHDLIRIEIEYLNGNVIITVPSWTNDGVDPEFGL